MTGQKSRYCGVVMGDIVRSEAMPSPEALHAAFNTAVNAQNAAHEDSLASPLTITLGDEFQGITHSLSSALPIVRDLRFRLMEAGVECRFVIGLIALRTAVNPDKAWNMMGSGLGRARDKLEEKKSGVLYRFSLEHDPTTETLLEAIGAGLAVIENDWTDQQRRDITGLMDGLKPAEIAARRNVSVHSIYKVRRSGHFDAYILQWQAVADALARIDTEMGLA